MKIEELFTSASDGCKVIGCNHVDDSVVLNASCHPGEGTKIEVNPRKRTVRITCMVCASEIVHLEFPFVN